MPPYLTDVYVSDHSCEAATTCTVIPDVDEECVNKKLAIGKPLGVFSPLNNCQTFTKNVIKACPKQKATKQNIAPVYGPVPPPDI